jgi:hypothetical protein
MSLGEHRPVSSSRLISVTSALFSAAAVCGLFVASCAHDDSSIFIRNVLAPPTSTNGTCSYTSDPTQPALLQAVMDVAFRRTYTAVVLVGNQLIARQDHDQIRTETSRVAIRGASVTVVDAQSGGTLASFTSLATGFIDPSQGAQPGFGSVEVTAINEAAGQAIGAVAGSGKKVISRFKVFGQTLGGVDVESNEFQMPIDVCNGCLVTFPPDSVDKALAESEKKPNCKAASTGGNVATPCTLGQDQPVDCRSCVGSNPICTPPGG